MDSRDTIDSRPGPAPPQEPIAIIGIGCRLPGEASSPSKLWDLLIEGRSGHCEVPPSRYNAEGFYHPDPERPGSVNSTGGYFIQEDINAFENAFFNINNLEALHVDPQQRKLLEVVYESFESAGVPLDKIRGSKSGVYIGNFTNDFMIMQYKDPEYFSRYSATGAGPTVLANRITHCFDLRGPSVVLDTACSSSLYALHFACLGLEAFDCDSAVVASANLIQSPEQQLIAVKAGILSPEAKCHTFDDAANGYGRAEGASSLYLKRLSDAIRDGDPIRSVIRGTAVNGNGRTPGIFKPSVEGQDAAIRAAYRRAKLPIDGTDYVEAHGTGTKVGDPIEIEGISRVFQHKSGKPTLIGGVKPNLGHSEGASGISSIIKAVLAIENRVIPATIGIKEINPSIKTEEWNVEIVRRQRHWPNSVVPRASINSFGFGGSNSHAILEARTMHNATKASPTTLSNGHTASSPNTLANSPSLLVFSARTKHSLKRLVEDLADYVSRQAAHLKLRDLAYTLGCRRSVLATRGYLLTSQTTLPNDLQQSKLILQGETPFKKVPLAFVYTGQGAQWHGMGRELIHQYPTFRTSIEYLDSCLQDKGSDIVPPWSLYDLLVATDDASGIHLATTAQSVCTAVQIAITDLLHEWGVNPHIVLGHSSGEIGAAYAAGHLTGRQAIMTAYYRGLSVSKGTSPGAMIALGIGRGKAQKIIEELGLRGKVVVACINSPESSTVSGDESAVDSLYNAIEESGVFVRKLKSTGIAYHSHHMKAVGPPYQRMLESAWRTVDDVPNGYVKGDANVHNKPLARMISTVIGAETVAAEVSSPAYWRRNLESPVNFEDAVKATLVGGHHHFIEIGPHASLKLPIEQTQNDLPVMKNCPYSSVLIRDKDAVVTALSLVGKLFLYGHDDLLFGKIISGGAEPRPDFAIDLPTYPWDYSSPSPWHEPRSVSEFRHRKYPRHDLLGSQVPGGSHVTKIWRNMLDVNEVTWLSDHCLGPSIVFPAAAFIAMAIEAMCQVVGLSLDTCPGVDLRNVNFMKALDFHTEQRSKVEIITEMRQSQVSSTRTSEHWWCFSISSLVGYDCSPTIHVNGLVSIADNVSKPLHRQIQINRATFEQQATRVWYDKFKKEGLNWGPKFAVMESIYCDRARKACQASSNIHLSRGDNSGLKGRPQYIAHPISIDAMLQTAFVATTGGWVRNLQATVPVTVDFAHISAPASLDMDTGKAWSVDARSESVGFGTFKIDAELHNSSGQVLISMNSVRCIRYQGKSQGDVVERRNPMVRVAWKPDITAFAAGANKRFSRYLDWFVRIHDGYNADVNPRLIRLASAIDLVAHKWPNLRILEVGIRPETTRLFMKVLRANTSLRRFASYFKGTLTADGELLGTDVTSGCLDDRTNSDSAKCVPKGAVFDLVIVSAVCDSQRLEAIEMLNKARSDECGTVVTLERLVGTLCDPNWDMVTRNQASAPVNVAFATKETRANRTLGLPDVILVNDRETPSVFDAKILSALEIYLSRQITIVGLSQISEASFPAHSIVISTLEAEQPLLSTISGQDMKSLKIITDRASKIFWITSPGLLSGSRPDFAPVLGLSRALMLEQPSVRFLVFDVGKSSANLDDTASNVTFAMRQFLEDPDPEFELAQDDSHVHVPRWEPEDSLNSRFRLKQDKDTVDMRVGTGSRYELMIRKPALLDTLHFQQEDYRDALPLGFVEIQVKSVGINAKDLYALGAKVDTRYVSCSCESAGVVTSIAPDVIDLNPGDRVVTMAPGHFATYERFPQWAVHKLRDDEEYTVASTVPVVFSTAIYALKHRANLQHGESILIHSAAGGVGIAAIQMAKHMGAEIFATVGTKSKKDFLVKSFGLDPARIFSSRDSSFLASIMSATSGQGVDVVLNSLSGDLLHSSLQACASFGRFVEIGKRDIIDHGNVDMATFGRNISFTAFDLSNLFLSDKPAHHKLWKTLIAESMHLIRTGIVKPCSPREVFKASEIIQAFRHFSNGNRIGKVAVSFEDGNDTLKVVPKQYEAIFSASKTYLMIGCLGGLGRSLTKWMMACGARNFVFLGPSGMERPAARILVEDLQKQGAVAEVMRGDVSKYNDVEQAVQTATLPIGGVIQAAMSLSEALWSSMSNNSWHTSIRPKVQGTWNLHNALRDQARDAQLDFFVMTSSILGTVGTVTESNYCAGNAFLDAFARYRNNLGLPAISIGLGMISEVGYLHEHPNIESLMKRKGVHTITEDELLQIMDLALANQDPKTWKSHHYDQLVSSHLLTGVEFIGLKDQRDRGFEGDNHVLTDPRASLFAAAFARSTAAGDIVGAAVSKGLPDEVAKALQDNSGSASVLEAVRLIVAKKISNLILLPVEKLNPEQRLGDFGLDSMLAAEFRTFIFRVLEVDVPFMIILAKTTTVESLAKLIVDGLEERRGE